LPIASYAGVLGGPGIFFRAAKIRNLEGKRAGARWGIIATFIPFMRFPASAFLLLFFMALAPVARAQMVKWRFACQWTVCSTPVICDSMVLFSSEDRNLYACNKTTGKLYWKFRSSHALYSSFPQVNDSFVVFATWDTLYALSRFNGQLRWTIPGVSTVPVLENGILYYGTRNKRMVARKIYGRDVIWDTGVSGVPSLTPGMSDTLLTIGCDDHSNYAIGKRDGRICWKYETQHYSSSSSQVRDTVALLSNFNNVFTALDTRTGARYWEYRVAGTSYSTPVFSDSCVIIGDVDGVLKVGLRSGRRKWKSITAGPVYCRLLLDKDVVYAACRDGCIYAISAASGKLKWKYRVSGYENNSDLVLDHGLLYFGNNDHYFYCLRVP
jgi:outer membrane protein assembly factor BamB